MKEEERLIGSLITGGCRGAFTDCVTGRDGVETERTFSQVDGPCFGSEQGEASKSKYMGFSL